MSDPDLHKECMQVINKLHDELATIKAKIAEIETAPLCAAHAETWYCERNTLKPKTGCVMCDSQATITRLGEALESTLSMLKSVMRRDLNIPEKDIENHAVIIVADEALINALHALKGDENGQGQERGCEMLADEMETKNIIQANLAQIEGGIKEQSKKWQNINEEVIFQANGLKQAQAAITLRELKIAEIENIAAGAISEREAAALRLANDWEDKHEQAQATITRLRETLTSIKLHYRYPKGIKEAEYLILEEALKEVT